MTTTLHPVALPVTPAQQALTGRAKVQALSQRARKAVHHSAALGAFVLGELNKDTDGVPLPSKGIYWSLTHKRTWVAGVAAPFAVGIDLETVRPVKEGLYQRVADDHEWALVGQANRQRFFRLWTAKEAVLKAEGLGIAGLGHCKIDTIVNDDTLHMAFDDRIWTVTHYRFADQQVMAVATKSADLQWHILHED
jgi:4'-phosphopantetheinyl transferase